MKFAHVTIMVKNMEESVKFYQDIVGLPIHRTFPTDQGEITFLGEGETKVELIYSREKEEIAIGQDISIGFQVDSLEETMKFIEKKGLSIHSGPIQPNPFTRFFYVLDPNGVKVQFIEMK